MRGEGGGGLVEGSLTNNGLLSSQPRRLRMSFETLENLKWITVLSDNKKLKVVEKWHRNEIKTIVHAEM